LDDEDVIQEFRGGNEALVSRLCQPDATQALIEFITIEPPEGAQGHRCFRYPFVAVELMTCAAAADSLAPIISRSDSFWDFLESTPPHEVNPVLAGYFARSAASFLATSHHTEIVEYLRARGADALLQRFLERLHMRSLAELLARFLCAEQAAQLVFSTEGLAELLVGRLSSQSEPKGSDTENVALITLELLAQKDSICYGDEILRQLTSPRVIEILMNHVFGSGPTAQAALSILTSLVFHTNVQPKGVSMGVTSVSTPMSTLSPPPLVLRGDDDLVNIGADDPLEALPPVGEVAPPRTPSPPRSPRTSASACPAAWLSAHGAALMRDICLHLPRLRTMLEGVLKRGPPPAPSSATCHSNVLGSTVLEVIGLLSMIVRTGSPEVLEAVLNEQLLPRCLEMFFQHPWSSLLHNAIVGLISSVASATDGVRPELVLSLLREGLGERLVEEYQAEAALFGTRQPGPRVGYMGHLYNVCCEFQDYGSRVPEVGSAFSALSGWSDVVLPELERITAVHAQDMGGGINSEERGLASSSAMSLERNSDQGLSLESVVRSDLDADLNLDSFGDPFEEDDFKPDGFWKEGAGDDDRRDDDDFELGDPPPVGLPGLDGEPSDNLELRPFEPMYGGSSGTGEGQSWGDTAQPCFASFTDFADFDQAPSVGMATPESAAPTVPAPPSTAAPAVSSPPDIVTSSAEDPFAAAGSSWAADFENWDPSAPAAPTSQPQSPPAPASAPALAPAPPIGRDPGLVEDVGSDVQASVATEPWQAMFEAPGPIAPAAPATPAGPDAGSALQAEAPAPQAPAPQPQVSSSVEVANDSLFNLLGNAAWEPSPLATTVHSPAVASVPVLASTSTPVPPGDRSWVADFDPLFQPNPASTGDGSGVRQASGLAGGTGAASDLGSLWAAFPNEAFHPS
jgi:hypothetical protein